VTPRRRRHLLTDRHALTNANRTSVARLCILLFNVVQNHPKKEEQLLALASAFLLMADALGIPAQDAFTAVKNMLADPMRASGIFHQFDAARHYLEADLATDLRAYA
jgi:hypothetical protein